MRLAAIGMRKNHIANYLGIKEAKFYKLANVEGGDVQMAYLLGRARVQEQILEKAVWKATNGDGHAIMLIYLSKALCGLTETPQSEDEVKDKAAAIRETMDRLNSGLDRFVGKDGKFVNPEDVPPPPVKKKRRGAKKRKGK